MKKGNNCSGTIPDKLTGCAPDNRTPQKICGTCRYFNPEYPINGKPRPVCLALKETKDGHTYKITLGVEPHFHCSNGKYENVIGR